MLKKLFNYSISQNRYCQRHIRLDDKRMTALVLQDFIKAVNNLNHNLTLGILECLIGQVPLDIEITTTEELKQLTHTASIKTATGPNQISNLCLRKLNTRHLNSYWPISLLSTLLDLSSLTSPELSTRYGTIDLSKKWNGKALLSKRTYFDYKLT